MFEKIKDFYGRHERLISSSSLLGGFIFDAFTLRRVDAFWENLFVLGHIVIIGTVMVWVHRLDEGGEDDPKRLKFWLVNIIQFFFGGLLSVFLVFYFRSGDLSASWPFLLILALMFLANERLRRQYVRLTFQVSLFYVSLFVVAVYLMPVVVHRIGDLIFVLSGVLATVIMFGFLKIIEISAKEKFKNSRMAILVSVILIFLVMNALYFTNLIPPLPLSLEDSGIYHSITREDERYIATYEKQGWFSFLSFYQTLHQTPNDKVFVYSAIFAPTDLNTNIIHEWQHYENGSWITSGYVELPVVGGREKGFRTFSFESGLTAGSWRVNVKTEYGALIDRVHFEVINVSDQQELYSKTL